MTMPTQIDVASNTAAAGQAAGHITTLMRRRSIPGLSIAITDRNRLLYAAGFGHAALRPARTTTASTSYLWFSMSKVATATAAMRLADDGRLDLDAPYQEYLKRPTGAGWPASVRQLLGHTAGAANPLPLRWVRPAADPARDDELLDRLFSRHGRPKHAVGGTARYSNLGYLILGKVIATAAGTPFRDFVQTAVLAPAGMRRTSFAYAATMDAATGYVKCPRIITPLLKALLPAGIVGQRHGQHTAFHPFLVDGAAYGGLVGDVTDAARLARLHLRDGELDGTRVISAASAREMRQLRYPGHPFDHGLAWFRKPDADPHRPVHVEHYGAGAGFWNAMRLYPEVGLGFVVMANTTAPYDVGRLFDTLRGLPWSS